MPLQDKYEPWIERADSLKLDFQERIRVDWMIYYEQVAERNVYKTCKHFGIAKKTFYKWFKRFSSGAQDVVTLKNLSRKPHTMRTWEISVDQENRIRDLRQKYIHYGKKKLKILYWKKYGEHISCWKIERVIRKHRLYPDKEIQEQSIKKLNLVRMKQKRSLAKLEKNKQLWFLFRIDTIVLCWNNHTRYIITAVDNLSKLGYARMYRTKNPGNLNDFLFKLNHFIQQPLENIQPDDSRDLIYNFITTAKKRNTGKYFSWVNTPRNDIEIERFIETLEYEWLYDGNLDYQCDIFNKRLAEWLFEYNFNRPHQALNYLSPVEYIQKKIHEMRLKKKINPFYIVKKITAYISNLEIDEIETLSVDKISMDLNINRRKSWQYFKKEKNITLKEYIFRIKICHAIALLQNEPELTVKEVAEKIGYYSYSYFISIFKQYFGITPGKYKELKRILRLRDKS